MKAVLTYLLCSVLMLSYTSMALGGQYAVLKSMISSGAASTIEAETGTSTPPDAKPFWTLRKYSLPAMNTDAESAPVSGKNPYHIPASEKITHHCIIYTILVSHFPYPPFWPRDPSLA